MSDTAASPAQDDVTGSGQGPYARAAHAYWKAGWTNVLPVHDGQGLPGKSHVPRGYTGIEGGSVSWPDLNAWTAGPEGWHNAGVRLIAMIGIDVDAHDGEQGEVTLAAAVEQLGPLPATWSSTSRGPGASRILFFRVPLAREPMLRRREKAFVDAFGANVEILHRAHRFAVVWPSIHPDTGREYRWYSPDGQEGSEPPPRGEVPELPEAWLNFLAPEVAPDRTDQTDEAGSGTGLFGQGQSVAPPDYRTESEAARILRDAVQAFIAPDADGRATRLLPSLALIAGHGVPGGFWTAGQAAAQIEAMANENGYIAKHGLADLRLQVERGLRDGALAPWVKVAEPAVDAFASATGEAQMSALDKMRSHLLNRDAMDELPLVEPLIGGLLDTDSESWIIGASGSFKSFIAVDFSCHVATSLTWRERYTKHGPVLYVAAEGRNGVVKRVQAWEKTYGVRATNIHILPLPVPVWGGDRAGAVSAEWRTLVEIAQEVKPVLIVIDTQARVTAGINENDNGQMGIYFRGVAMLKDATQACVLTVHHTGRDEGDARGASAIDAAQDAELKIQRPKGAKRKELTARILLDKQKDRADKSFIEVKLDKVTLGIDPWTGQEISSLAVLPYSVWKGSEVEHASAPDWKSDLDGVAAEVMTVMEDHAATEDGATFPEVRRWIDERRAEKGNKSKVAQSTLSTAIKRLCGEPVGGVIAQQYLWRPAKGRVAIQDASGD